MMRSVPALYGSKAAYTLTLLGLLACCCRRTTAQNEPPLWGRPVTRLSLECDCSLKLQSFPGAVTQRSVSHWIAQKSPKALSGFMPLGAFRNCGRMALPMAVEPLSPSSPAPNILSES